MTRKQFEKMTISGCQELWAYHCGDVVEVEYVSSNSADFEITFQYEEKLHTQSARNLYLSWDDALCMIDDDSWKRIRKYLFIYIKRTCVQPLRRFFNWFMRIYD